MKLKEIIKTKPEGRTKRINIRITKSQSIFIVKNNISPTKLFNKALEELK